ncbi:MAG: T9SS type A sorting domain-containing protein, partial [bacterium]|nr:T9SS type A sorting domain-containing protein [bacterium]
NHGQLGDSTTTNRFEPVQTHILTNVSAIAAGHYHSLAVANVLGIEESENDELGIMDYKLQAYPNPFRSVTSIQNQVSSIQVYDLSGRLIETTKGNTIGKNLKPGVYFLKAEGYKPVKVIKLR